MPLTVAIDAGHPSWPGDTGAQSACGRVVECNYTLAIARRLHHLVEVSDEDINPAMLRTGADEVLSVSDRAYRADELGADLVLSIHVDNGAHVNYRGASILFWPGNSTGQSIANQIASSWPPVLRRSPRGSPAHEHLWPRARNVIGTYRQTAILAECGYASNPANVDALVEESVQAQIVGALMQGLRLCRQLRDAHWLGG